MADGVVSPLTGVDQDVSRMSIKVGVMVGDLVLMLCQGRCSWTVPWRPRVTGLSDVLKFSLISLVVVLTWVCVPTPKLFEVGL